MLKFFRRLFCLIGNYCPPKLNSFFYKLAGVKFNFKKVWFGNNCYLDTVFPENIIIEDNVCCSYRVTLIAHFDPGRSIKNHIIRRYKNKIKIEEGVFIGPGTIILPGVTIKKNSFIRAGAVIKNDTKQNSIIEGNPQKQVGIINEKLFDKFNLLNKNNQF